jgi:hypothetical protein
LGAGAAPEKKEKEDCHLEIVGTEECKSHIFNFLASQSLLLKSETTGFSLEFNKEL